MKCVSGILDTYRVPIHLLSLVLLLLLCSSHCGSCTEAMEHPTYMLFMQLLWFRLSYEYCLFSQVKQWILCPHEYAFCRAHWFQPMNMFPFLVNKSVLLPPGPHRSNMPAASSSRRRVWEGEGCRWWRRRSARWWAPTWFKGTYHLLVWSRLCVSVYVHVCGVMWCV